MKILNPRWIWNASPAPKRNGYFRFRRVFKLKESATAKLRVSADSRYWLYLDGQFLGTGPVRSWPEHWKYDEYDLTAYLQAGTHVISVLVNHYGEGNFQYIVAPPGLWVRLSVPSTGAEKVILETDAKWKTAPSLACRSLTARISCQESFEEQFDARLEDDWKHPHYDDEKWGAGIPITPPHSSLSPSGIPLLTREPVFPSRILRAEMIRPCTQTWTLQVKPYFAPDDVDSKMCFLKGYLFTQVWSKIPQTVKFRRPHNHFNIFKVNGRTIPSLNDSPLSPFKFQQVKLRAGWNRVLIPYPSLETSADGIKPPDATHFPQFALAVSAEHPLRWSATGKNGGAPWAFVGPFPFSEKELKAIETNIDFPRLSIGQALDASATRAIYHELLVTGGADDQLEKRAYFREFTEADVVICDIAAAAFADEVEQQHLVHCPEALLSDNNKWARIDPPESGCDVRVLIDFGKEILGTQLFEVEAGAGVIIDVHNFEFIQPDGLENYAEGMNNSFRYVCRGGQQSFRTLQRRGFQYAWLIIRNQRRPIRIRTFHAEFTSYPQARRGSFHCNDELLNRIWDVGAHTLRCCSEDTYTDCPTYEQTHWVGDARNEALIDWVINGDPHLWFRCLEQTAQSLERSPITISQVPSSWDNILPAWSFLWMRSCREYLLWTGDYAGAAKLLPWVIRNVDGIEKHVNSDGLFEMQGWNMFDWAAMDTPNQGVITHLNCFGVLALNECAELASWLQDKASARRFTSLAKSMAKAVNRHLWHAKRRAYIDSIHHDRTPSTVFSQQTQTVALISGVASGARAARSRSLIHQPPDDFVKAGSPFFEFFLLEVLAGEGKAKEFLDVIRRDWGFMIDKGATTFWEMWSLKSGRLTRSHCHGWSAAPTFFLSTVVLGIQPTKPGFAEIRFSPQLGNLDSLRGVVPTPRGPIEIQCERKGKTIETRLKVPKGIKVKRARKI